MSVISLFYGQCGNQICDSLFASIYDDVSNSRKDSSYYVEGVNRWFNVTKTKKLECRAILVDTELKTAQEAKGGYHFRNIVSRACGGSANNWAFGYKEQSKLLVGDIIECTRTELEKCDNNCSFVNVFSSSGGTGSGIGSFMTEYLKDEFSSTVLDAVILPYSNGELITQSYNSLLSLSKIYSSSDGVLLFENDRLHYNCINSLSLKDVDFTDLNQLITRQILSMYQPLNGLNPVDLLTTVLDPPKHKFLDIRLAPLSKLESPDNIKCLIGTLSRQSRYDYQQRAMSKIILKPKSLKVALICRGVYHPLEKDLKPLIESQFLGSHFEYFHHKKRFFNQDNCLSVVSNSNNCYIPLKLIVQDAYNMYKYGAYLHHYQKFGIDRDYFRDCFDSLNTVLNDYQSI